MRVLPPPSQRSRGQEAVPAQLEAPTVAVAGKADVRNHSGRWFHGRQCELADYGVDARFKTQGFSLRPG
jgi:hypothetical protein